MSDPTKPPGSHKPQPRPKRAAESNLQLFALTLLLTTPSRLQELWLNNDSSDAWREKLKDLGFTDVEAGVRFMGRLRNRSMFFEGVGSLLRELRDEYPEPPPHPPDGVDAELVRRLA